MTGHVPVNYKKISNAIQMNFGGCLDRRKKQTTTCTVIPNDFFEFFKKISNPENVL